MGNGQEIVDKLRASLILENQAEAVRFITEKDERIKHLEELVGALNHSNKALRFEITARNAALAELTRELAEERRLNPASVPADQNSLSADRPDGKIGSPPSSFHENGAQSPPTTRAARLIAEEAPGATRSENAGAGSLVLELLSDKCMIPGEVPGIYQYGVRPLSRRAADRICELEARIEDKPS